MTTMEKNDSVKSKRKKILRISLGFLVLILLVVPFITGLYLMIKYDQFKNVGVPAMIFVSIFFLYGVASAICSIIDADDFDESSIIIIPFAIGMCCLFPGGMLDDLRGDVGTNVFSCIGYVLIVVVCCMVLLLGIHAIIKVIKWIIDFFIRLNEHISK